jgi:DNA primase
MLEVFFARMLISPEKLSELKDSVDIVETISEYLPLKKTGKRFRGLCPFHPDKDPSFYVSPDRQNYRCFGCGASGDVISFVQAIDHLSFTEAVRMLARRAGIEIEINEPSGRTSATLKANEFACRYFEHVLFETEEGKPCRDYLKARGMGRDIAKQFRLGYAPAGWESFKQFAAKNGFDQSGLVESGLLTESKKGTLIDFFRQRLMFPILDTRSRVIAFGGRVLDNSLPKYINSPETSLFKKSETLYGLNLAKASMFAKRSVIVTEGYTDVVRAHEKGIDNTVATLGTAFTDGHARVLKRYVDIVYVVFDSDSAGKKAAERSLEILLGQELGIKIVQLPGGADLFDYLGTSGIEGFERFTEGAVEFLDFKYEKVRERHDLSSTRGRASAADELLTVLKAIGNPILRDLEIKRVATLIGTDEAGLRQRVGTFALTDTPARRGECADLRDLHLIDILMSRQDLVQRVVDAFPPESYADADYGRIAAIVYDEFEETGRVSTTCILESKDGEYLHEKLMHAVRLIKEDGDSEKDYDKLLSGWIAKKEEEHLANEIRRKTELPAAAISEYFELKKKAGQKHKV